IDRAIRSGKNPDKKYFVEKFEVSSKSIERDFEFMRERLGAPLKYHSVKRGYYYSEMSYFLPGNMMNESELFALLMSQQIVGGMGNSPIKNSLAESCRNLSKYIPTDLKTDFNLSLSRFSIISEPSVTIGDDTWQLVLRSLRKNRQLLFDYKKSAGKNDYIQKVIFPYHIVSWRGSWYIIGQNPQKERIETYAICRMKNLKVGQSFPFPADFDVNKYVDSELGLYVDSAMHQIAVRFKNWCAPYIRERVWHRTQSIEELEDGGLILRFDSDQMETTRQWVVRWGNGALVLEPPELVYAMQKMIKDMAEQYDIK
ncbi:WYL domain-containing protein, partial [bacterium]|nr:WYL domain-containing protein [bacterium]